jgi:hypothetical protein
MEQLILNIKDSSKLSFLMQLIKQLNFVKEEIVKRAKTSSKYDLCGLRVESKISEAKVILPQRQ